MFGNVQRVHPAFHEALQPVHPAVGEIDGVRRRIGGDGLRLEQVRTPSATSRSRCQSRRNVGNWTNRKSLEELEAAN